MGVVSIFNHNSNCQVIIKVIIWKANRTWLAILLLIYIVCIQGIFEAYYIMETLYGLILLFLRGDSLPL